MREWNKWSTKNRQTVPRADEYFCLRLIQIRYYNCFPVNSAYLRVSTCLAVASKEGNCVSLKISGGPWLGPRLVVVSRAPGGRYTPAGFASGTSTFSTAEIKCIKKKINCAAQKTMEKLILNDWNKKGFEGFLNKGPQAPQEEKRSILHRFTHPQEQEEARHQTCSRDLFHLVLHWREWSLHPHQPPPSRTPLPLSRHYKQPGGSKAEVNTCPAADITECIKADLQSYSAKVRTESSMSCVSLYIYYTAKQRCFLLFPSPEWQHSNMADLEFWVQSQRL